MGLITYVHDVGVLCVYGWSAPQIFVPGVDDRELYLADFIDTAR